MPVYATRSSFDWLILWLSRHSSLGNAQAPGKKINQKCIFNELSHYMCMVFISPPCRLSQKKNQNDKQQLIYLNLFKVDSV